MLQAFIMKRIAGAIIKNVEKDVAQLKVDSHPPVFMKDDYKDIIKRLKKLEKRRK